MPTQEPFELLGVKGLLLPGTVERWAPWFHEMDAMFYFRAWESEASPECFEHIACQAATAACWWLSEYNENFTVHSHPQFRLWFNVFELACERMK